MRTRLHRRIAATVAGLVLALSIGVRPAQASADNVPYNDVVNVLVSLLDKLSDGGITPAEAAQLVQEVINAVNGVKTDVVSRLDSQLVNELKGKVQFATTSTHYLTNAALAGLYTVKVNEAAHLAKAHVDTVSSDHDLDAVGRAMITLYKLLEVGEAKQGILDPRTRFADYRQGLERLIEKMEPRCDLGGIPTVGQYWEICTYGDRSVRVDVRIGWNGSEISVDGGEWVPGVIQQDVIVEMVMSDTAEKLAKDALEQLRQRGY